MKAIRDLEREYKRRREAILSSSASWEAKQKEIYRLFQKFRRRKEELEESA